MKKWVRPEIQKLLVSKTLGNQISGTEANSNSNNGHTASILP